MANPLKDGLKDSSTPSLDRGGGKPATEMGPSVDAGASRKGTAPSPKSLGPRSA